VTGEVQWQDPVRQLAEVEHFTHDGALSLTVKAGRWRDERVVPPAGEEHAFTRRVWPHRVVVAVSPTGRSVRVWVNGRRIDLKDDQ
jgi:hypothetical protein